MLCVQVLPVAVVFVAAQTLFTLSLANTSVTSNTILSSSSSMWTLLASACVLGERVTPIKLLSVLAVMAGGPVMYTRDRQPGATMCRDYLAAGWWYNQLTGQG